MDPLIRVVERLLWPLRRRVLLMIGRAVVRLVDNASQRQTVQVEGLAGELIDSTERFQEYGFSSVPPAESEAVLLAVGGMRQHVIVAAVEEKRVRPQGAAPGTVTLYTRLDAASGGAHRITLDGAARRAVVECRDPGAAVGATITVEAARIVLACGRSSITLTDAGVDIDAPRFRGRRVA